MCDPLGPAEVAALLGVKVGTVHQWRWRGRLPEPTYLRSGVPLWERAEVESWARETGRDERIRMRETMLMVRAEADGQFHTERGWYLFDRELGHVGEVAAWELTSSEAAEDLGVEIVGPLPAEDLASLQGWPGFIEGMEVRA